MPFEMNHKFPPLDRMNIKIAQGSMPFEANSKSDGKRKLLLNNFDAAVRSSSWTEVLSTLKTLLIGNREVTRA